MTFSTRVRLALVVWLAMLGLDFLLNGAVFAGLYQGHDGFILAPQEAFRRIPIGYLAFLILALSMVELAYRLGVDRAVEGLRLGLVIGCAWGATWSLGLYSIATLTATLAAVFAVTWLALVVLGSAVAALGMARRSLRGLALRVAAFDLLCAAAVVAFQSFGVVPSLAR